MRRSIAAASPSSRGLPRISPSTTTVVSAPRITIVVGGTTPSVAIAAADFSAASRRNVNRPALRFRESVVDVDAVDIERIAGEAQQFSSTRRRGSQHEAPMRE